MSFADIINAESKKLEESQGGGDKVQYPETKHKKLFFSKDETQLILQVLPSPSLVAAFAEPTRKIFLNAKSTQGKDINSNFTLDAEPNPGSLLEAKIAEWTEKQMIPNNFGGQARPKNVFLVNVVKVVPNPAQAGTFTQERDDQGNLVVRVFEMAQSGYSNLIRKLQDPMLNGSGSELSFMDPNKPFPIKISKPAKGQMEYPVDVYTNIPLPPLGQGWENQLEDLKAQAVPTERLENGYNWVAAFVDMKEGRKPQNRSKDSEQGGQQQQPQANPYQQNQQPTQQQQPQADPFASQAPQQQQADPFANTAPQQQQADPFANAAPQQNVGPVDEDPFAGSQLADSNLPPAPTQQSAPAPQQQQPNSAPQQQSNPAPQQTAPNLNNNGLNDIDAMLAAELNS